MSATGKEFIEHWNWAAEKGVMNKNTAGGIRTACTQVLSVDTGWETLDIKTLDIEGILTRFQNLKAKKFKPAVLNTYKGRFRQGVALYLQYLEDPAGWKPRTVERATPTSDRTNGGDQTSEGMRKTAQKIPQTGLVEYPFPLREDQITRLFLPRDLKSSEVRRLSAFMATLIVDVEPQQTTTV